MKRSLFILVAIAQGVLAQQPDRFADIATRSAVRTNGLIEPAPPVLPATYLPPLTHNRHPFQPGNPMDTREELTAELQRKRAEYAPFLRNLAPELPATRSVKLLDTFDWRVATDDDRSNMQAVLAGKGNWSPVKIPHFGPPIGKATTYYRTSFTLSAEQLRNHSVVLRFGAVDYKATVYLNGNLLGTHEGFFAPFELEAGPAAREGENVLLVQVDNDYGMLGYKGKKGDKVYAAANLGYDDPQDGWHHGPPGMGIWQDVRLEIRPLVQITDVFVRPLIEKDSAELWLEVTNTQPTPQLLRVSYSVYGQNFEQTVFTNRIYTPATVHVPGVGDLIKPTNWEQKTLPMGQGPNFLRIPFALNKPRLWSPQTPYLYQIQVRLLDEQGGVVDAQQRQFGMRSFWQDTLSSPKGMFYLNGQPIRLRGANTMGHVDQCVFRKDFDQLRDDLLLAKIANMNFLRMTQRAVQREVYEYADRLGVMLQSDLPLFGVIRRNKVEECLRQTAELERLVRGHPSNVLISYINEKFPNGEGEPHRHVDQAHELEAFFTAANQVVHLLNPDRVIKPGDGDYDPPTPGLPDAHCYNAWYNGHGLPMGKLHKGYWQLVKPGWYYACGEFGAEGLDPYATMLRYYPKQWLPQTSAEEAAWTPARIADAQTYNFHFMWMNPQRSVRDWIAESQAFQQWATRYYVEAFRRDNRMVSTAIHLFIDAWPAGWMKTIMDVDRNPKPAFFAFRDGMMPIAVQTRTDRTHFFAQDSIRVEAWVANDTPTGRNDVRLRYQWEQPGKVLLSNQTTARIDPNEATFQGYITLKAPVVRQRTVFQLRTTLMDKEEKRISEHVLDVTVFPAPTATSLPSAVVMGQTKARRLATDLGLSASATLPDSYRGMIVIDEYARYEANRQRVDEAVQNGATCLFLELPAGRYQVGRDSVEVRNCTMGSYYFVSPQTQHPLTNGFEGRDFFFWYDRATDYPTPIIDALLYEKGPGWQPILRSGQTGWYTKNGYANAVSEKTVGKGRFILSQVKLAGRTKENPVADLFSRRLVNAARVSSVSTYPIPTRK